MIGHKNSENFHYSLSPNLITKYEIDIDHSLFYYEGEYSYTFAYNVNDFIFITILLY